jgi:hypothetical protein
MILYRLLLHEFKRAQKSVIPEIYSRRIWKPNPSFKKSGINVEGVSLNLEMMLKQKDKAVRGLTRGIDGLFKKNEVRYINSLIHRFDFMIEQEVEISKFESAFRSGHAAQRTRSINRRKGNQRHGRGRNRRESRSRQHYSGLR